jgi:hypothetical protein
VTSRGQVLAATAIARGTPVAERVSMHRIALVAALLVASQADASPTVDKKGIVFHLKPHTHKPEWSWTPTIRMKIAGPISSSAAITVEYTLPNGKPFTKIQCENTSATAENEFLTLNDCGYSLEDKVAITQTGVFGFKVLLTDGLAGTSETLFSGKFTVGKGVYNPTKAADRNKQFYYYVDQDWRLPLAYAGTHYGDLTNSLVGEVWVKQQIADLSKIRGYLFFNGKQVAETSGSFPLRATPPELKQWEYHQVQLIFPAHVEKPDADGISGWKLYENPGEYEIKMLRDNKIARTFKFTIGKDGKPVDTNGAGKAVAKEGALVRATVGDGDGTWRKDAWKTEAFFANPASGL